MKLSELKAGDKVRVDKNCTCLDHTLAHEVKQDGPGLASMYLDCAYGRHYLDGQLDSDGETLVGILPYIGKVELQNPIKLDVTADEYGTGVQWNGKKWLAYDSEEAEQFRVKCHAEFTEAQKNWPSRQK